MSESAASGVPENARVDPARALSGDAIRTVLADFESWLLDLSRKEADNGETSAPSREVDLATLLEQMIALRQEIHLQTRTARTQQEQTAEALHQLGEALTTLRQAHAPPAPSRPEVSEDLQRPLLKTLIDLYDSLALAGREIDRLQHTTRESLAAMLDRTPPRGSAERRGWLRSLWARWTGQRPALEPGPGEEREGEARLHQLLGSLVTGYSMSLQRIERALQQHGLEPIATVGQRFDPERMEAVDVAADSGQPAGQVLEEARRGYLWRGRVFRYAQVRVAR